MINILHKNKIKSFMLGALMASGLITLAQNTPAGTQYRLVQPSPTSRPLEYAVVLDLTADAAYTAGSYSNAQIVLLYSDGTTMTQITTGRGNQGTWGESGPFDHSTVSSICSQNTTPQFDMTLYQLSNTISLGNCTGGCVDTMIIFSASPAVSGGIVRLHDGSVVTSGASTLDECLGTQPSPGVNHSGDLDPDGAGGPLTTIQWDLPGAGTAPLPVDLISFDANIYNDYDAKLDWATASELNNSHFEVQRSFDGYNFTTIDEVKGNGTSHSLINYSYIDETIPTHQNIVYYRLNQVDYNGESELSDVRLVQFEGFSNAPLVVYPNPTKSETTILLGDNVSQGEYTITDLVGKQWMADIVRAGSKSIELDFTNLPSGVYIATLNTENDSKHVRIVKK